MSFESVTKLEERLVEFFGAPYVVCLDACTHGIELCLRLTESFLQFLYLKELTYRYHFLANKLNIKLEVER